PGTSIWYGPSPTGIAMAVPEFEPFGGDPNDPRVVGNESTPPAVIVSESAGRSAVFQQAGGRAISVERPPREGDYIFLQPTRTNPIALGAWSVVPNMHYFWLLDAVTQNRAVPTEHLVRIAVYSLLQIGVFLSLAVILFQRRDVG
ncbi:MAG: hypothetical protein AAFN41_07115, partial [Planctomycetota bacterium]